MNIQYLNRKNAPRLAYVHTPGSARIPPAVFMGGYRSDMNGTKASFLQQKCEERKQEFLRFDYSGHGSSDGKFEDGTIGSWMQDALDVIDHVMERPAIIVGSSMGGWIAMLVSQRRPKLVRGLIGIAAAPDFTGDMYESLGSDQKARLARGERIKVADEYGQDSYTFTKEFFEDGERHFLLNKTQKAEIPIRLIQGMEDKTVPWQTAVNIQKTFEGGEVDVVFVEEGDHRLSRAEDLELLDSELRSLSGL